MEPETTCIKVDFPPPKKSHSMLERKTCNFLLPLSLPPSSPLSEEAIGYRLHISYFHRTLNNPSSCYICKYVKPGSSSSCCYYYYFANPWPGDYKSVNCANPKKYFIPPPSSTIFFKSFKCIIIGPWCKSLLERVSIYDDDDWGVSSSWWFYGPGFFHNFWSCTASLKCRHLYIWYIWAECTIRSMSDKMSLQSKLTYCKWTPFLILKSHPLI